MNLRSLAYCLILFTIAQCSVWFQTNGQFVWEWARKNPFLISLAGVPISMLYMTGTKYGAEAFGSLWPQRFLSFAVGMVVFGILTNVVLGEAMSVKAWISIVLALLIIGVQAFMK